ncbi:F-box/kelch-repeat protein At1g57790-like [Papaver somniferum]|uniref:F-box/kelch-repeat protein At1g57790-like n=1 Tax=Papaver somniferum TaxID=3469 RepID=UPI000E6FBFA1|nr:F-box/kelch-repeat protein At1g57790-like [Papaver somniferum]
MLLIIEKVNDVWKPYKFHADNSRKFLACYNNPVFYKGNFYALDYNGTLGVFNLEDSRDERNFDKSNWEVLPETLTQFDGVNPSYLVECEGELLLVNFERPFGKLVEVFKLDPCKMKWVKVKSLGNYSLFISHTSSFSVIAPDSSMANKIYFSRLHGESERILYYSLDTGKYHYIGSEQSSEDFYNTKSMVNCTWIEPNWSPNPAKNTRSLALKFTATYI